MEKKRKKKQNLMNLIDELIITLCRINFELFDVFLAHASDVDVDDHFIANANANANV